MIILGGKVKLPLQMMFTEPHNSEKCSTYGNYLYDLGENLYRSHQIVRKNLKCAVKIKKDKYDKGSHLKQNKTGYLA